MRRKFSGKIKWRVFSPTMLLNKIVAVMVKWKSLKDKNLLHKSTVFPSQTEYVFGLSAKIWWSRESSGAYFNRQPRKFNLFTHADSGSKQNQNSEVYVFQLEMLDSLKCSFIDKTYGATFSIPSTEPSKQERTIRYANLISIFIVIINTNKLYSFSRLSFTKIFQKLVFYV